MSDEKASAATSDVPRGPLVPRPAVMLIALAIVGLLIWHVQYDARHEAYDGGKTTILLGAIVLFTLGFDIGKWFRGGGAA